MDPTTLKAARVEQDYTQSELAAVLNVSLATITSWECGRRNIHPKRKREVERVLRLPDGCLGSSRFRRGPQPLRPERTRTAATRSDDGPNESAATTPSGQTIATPTTGPVIA